MRSWSIPVGRLFGVDVRLHLTFLILPVFVFYTEYYANGKTANGPRDLVLVGIILACVAAHECGHIFAAKRFGLIPKAVILLPLTGVTLYEDSRTEKPATPPWKREIWLAMVGPVVNLALAGLSIVAIGASGRRNRVVEVAFSASGEFAAQFGVGQSLSCALESYAGLSAGWGTHHARSVLPPARSFVRHTASCFDQHRDCNGFGLRGLVQR